jgi:hypothetical protein
MIHAGRDPVAAHPRSEGAIDRTASRRWKIDSFDFKFERVSEERLWPNSVARSSGGTIVLWVDLAALSSGRPIVRDGARFEAAEALKQAALNPDDFEAIGRAAGLLRRTAHVEADLLPRHAAVALSAWDAIECTNKPFGSDARRQVFWEASQLLLKQLISTKDEMSLLDRMDAAGLERVPPFEDTLAGRVFAELNGEDVR